MGQTCQDDTGAQLSGTGQRGFADKDGWRGNTTTSFHLELGCGSGCQKWQKLSVLHPSTSDSICSSKIRSTISIKSISLITSLHPQLDQLLVLSRHIAWPTPENVSYHAHHCTACESFFTYCTLNRVCLHCFPIDATGPLSRVYNNLPTTATNDHFRLPCIHLLSFVQKASSSFSHTSAKLLHSWCHKYWIISKEQHGRQTTSRLTGDNTHDSSSHQWTQY